MASILSLLGTPLAGVPIWAWLLGVALGFALEWVIEWIWWRGRGSGKSVSYELETELQAARKEVAMVRGGTEMQGLQSNFNAAAVPAPVGEMMSGERGR